ncbi:MAG: exonuclease SbcCD subunit D [bacterium]
MKFIHVADLHLGKKIKTIRGDLQLEFDKAIEQLIQIVREIKPTFLFIAGDIFHYKNPSQEAEELFIKLLLDSYKNVKYTIIISGNHDNSKKLQNISLFNRYINQLVSTGKIFIYTDVDLLNDIANDKISPLQEIEEADIIPLPFIEYRNAVQVALKSKEIPEEYAYSYIHSRLIYEFLKKSNKDIKILVGHMFVDQASICGTESRNFISPSYTVKLGDLPDSITYYALGHVHRYQKVSGKNIYYAGSIIPLDFSETFEHGIIIGEIVDKFPKIQFHRINYREFKILKISNLYPEQMFDEIEKNKDRYIKILYTEMQPDVREKIMKFENVLKIEKEQLKVVGDSIAAKRNNDHQNQRSFEYIDLYNVVGIYSLYYSKLKGINCSSIILEKLDHILKESENLI